MKPGKFGLSEIAYNNLKHLLISFSDFSKVKVFGSRAIGTYKEGSDIDLVVYGDKITPDLIRTFKIKYEDLNLPYFIDILQYETIDNTALKAHIDQFSIDFY
ncbi:MAG TPA: nucleotidyltransferase domain-containing protein [Pseudobdellovibrionaceae bacterium]|nr:nucleotidyltransferase domain-containing protein [Pseudobdellovibrionaceae bacterium]